MKVKRSALGVIISLVVLAGLLSLPRGSEKASAATTLTLVPVADTYVSAAAPSTVYGASNRLVVDGSPVSRVFIRFDLTAVTGTVQSARLRLHVANVFNAQSPAGGSVASTTSTAWSEASTSWNNQPAIDGPLLGALGAVSRNTWVEIDVTQAVDAGAIVSLALSSTNSNGAYYDSRQSGALAPQLILSVDEPTTVTPTATPSETPIATPSPTPTATATPSPTATPTPSPTATPSPAPGPSTVLSPVADAHVDSGAPSTAYGTSTQLIVDGSPVREAYLRFDLTSLSGPVKDARLRLHVSNTASAGTPWGGTVALVSNVTWDEATLTYANRPTGWGTTAAAFGVVAVNTWVEVNVTAAVTTGAPVTFGVRSANTDGAYYDSRESGANAPQLIVTLGTPASVDNGVVVAAVGDMVCAPSGSVTSTTCRQLQVSNIVANDPAVQVFLALGDLQYENGELAYFQSAYEASYGRFKAKTKPAVGNHEYNMPGAAGYYDYFGAAAGDPAKGYYSFDVGATWHVVALNSNCSVVSCAAGSAQEQWLRNDLAATSRACVLAFWHHPRFSSGSHGSNTAVAPFWNALQARGAELVLVGHDHDYERFAPQLPSGIADAAGITEFIVGTGGKSLSAFGTTKANSALRFGSFGVLRLTLGDGAYAWQFVDEAGGILDSGTGSCH